MKVVRSILAVFAALFVAAPASAETEYVQSNGPLSQLAFYRTVACAGAMDQSCSTMLLRWPAKMRRGLTVGISQIEPSAANIGDQVNTALTAAITEINHARAGIHLTPVTGRAAQKADIRVFVVNTNRRGRITQTNSALLNGQTLPTALVRMRHRGNDILRADIALNAKIEPDSIRSVMLEELVQSMGLMTDILNPHYRHRSVFAEDCDCTSRLAGQDLAALRMHYPPEN